jgi:nitrogen fixation NifU-like protein
MSNDLGDMHQDVIIDHGRHPYNLRKLEDATRTAQGVNPLCANQLTGHLELTDGRINGIGFQGSGGAISQTCASLLPTVRTGKSGEEALALFGDVRAVLTEESDGEVDLARLGSIAALPPNFGLPHVGQVRHARRYTPRGALDDDDAPRTRE